MVQIRPDVLKLILNLTKLSMECQLLIKTKMLKSKSPSLLSNMLIKVKMSDNFHAQSSGCVQYDFFHNLSVRYKSSSLTL